MTVCAARPHPQPLPRWGWGADMTHPDAIFTPPPSGGRLGGGRKIAADYQVGITLAEPLSKFRTTATGTLCRERRLLAGKWSRAVNTLRGRLEAGAPRFRQLLTGLLLR